MRGHPVTVDLEVLSERDFKAIDLLFMVIDGRLDFRLEVVRKNELHFCRNISRKCRAHSFDIRIESAVGSDVLLD